MIVSTLLPGADDRTWLVDTETDDGTLIAGKVSGDDDHGWAAYEHMGRGRFRLRRNPENGNALLAATRADAVNWVIAQLDNR